MIRLYTGPMFSGKSTKFIDLYKSDGTWIAIKPKMDTRYIDDVHNTVSYIVSHDQRRIPAMAIERDGLSKHHYFLSSVKHVLIDEGQFFDDLLEGCLELVFCGYDVRVAALNGTAHQEPWPSVVKLLPYVDRIKYFSSKCDICNKPASFTILKDRHTKLGSGNVLIGGKDLYIPVCRDHLSRPLSAVAPSAWLNVFPI